MQRNLIELNLQFSRIRSGGCGPAFASLVFNWILSNNREVHLHRWRLVHCVSLGQSGQEEFFQGREHPQQHSGPSDKALSGDKMTKYTTDMGFMWTAVCRNALMDDMVATGLHQWRVVGQQVFSFLQGEMTARTEEHSCRGGVQGWNRTVLLVPAMWTSPILQATNASTGRGPIPACRRKTGGGDSELLVLCDLVFLVAWVPRCQLRGTCVVFAWSACVWKEMSSSKTQTAWSANKIRSEFYVMPCWRPPGLKRTVQYAPSTAMSQSTISSMFFWFCVSSLKQRNWCAETWKRQKGNPCPAACASQQRLPSLLAMTDLRYLHGQCEWESTECALSVVLCVDG